MEKKPKNSVDLAFRKAVRNGDLQSAKQFILSGVDPMEADSLSLRTAARNGDVQMLEFFIPRSQPSAKKFEALKSAVISGNEDCLAILLPHASPVDVAASGAMAEAVSLDRQRMLEMLIFMADPSCLMDGRLAIKSLLTKRQGCFEILSRAMYESGGEAPFLAAERRLNEMRRPEETAILRAMLESLVLTNHTLEQGSIISRRSFRI